MKEVGIFFKYIAVPVPHFDGMEGDVNGIGRDVQFFVEQLANFFCKSGAGVSRRIADEPDGDECSAFENFAAEPHLLIVFDIDHDEFFRFGKGVDDEIGQLGLNEIFFGLIDGRSDLCIEERHDKTFQL